MLSNTVADPGVDLQALVPDWFWLQSDSRSVPLYLHRLLQQLLVQAAGSDECRRGPPIQRRAVCPPGRLEINWFSNLLTEGSGSPSPLLWPYNWPVRWAPLQCTGQEVINTALSCIGTIPHIAQGCQVFESEHGCTHHIQYIEYHINQQSLVLLSSVLSSVLVSVIFGITNPFTVHGAETCRQGWAISHFENVRSLFFLCKKSVIRKFAHFWHICSFRKSEKMCDRTFAYF